MLSGRRRGPAEIPLRMGLQLACIPYAAATWVRRRLYRWRLLPARTAPIPVICVGNITTGGTGKTPMVAWVVARLHEMGHRPAILTRGYKAVAGRSDEAELLGELTGAPVIVNPDRAAGAAEAAGQGADVAVMDDGFQHLRLRRDLDIVLIDATEPFGYGHCLPRGLLREPRSALYDAAAVVITRSEQLDKEALGKLKTRLSRLAPAATVHTAVHRPVRIVDALGGEHPPYVIEDRRIFAFCGLGNPNAFFDTVSRLGAEVTGRKAFGDHAQYPPQRLSRLYAEAREAGAELLVTTAKDAVKLPKGPYEVPIWQVGVEMSLVQGERALGEALGRAACERAETPAGPGVSNPEGESDAG